MSSREGVLYYEVLIKASKNNLVKAGENKNTKVRAFGPAGKAIALLPIALPSPLGGLDPLHFDLRLQYSMVSLSSSFKQRGELKTPCVPLFAFVRDLMASENSEEDSIRSTTKQWPFLSRVRL
jgi:hypothetical protein